MSEGIAGSGIELGITLYSLTSEFAAGLYTPETLIKAVADEGLGPGVEFNIAQMLRTYPDVDDDFVRLWRDSMDRYGLSPSAVGTNLDMGRRKDRDMTPDEEYDFFAAQLRTAQQARFPPRGDPLRRQGAAPPAASPRREVRPEARLRDPRTAGPERSRDPADPGNVRGTGKSTGSASPQTSAPRCTAFRRRCSAR